MPRPAPLPGPSNLVPPSRTGTEDGHPGAAPADGVASTLGTETWDAGQARVAPDPAEMPGRVVPDPEVPDPEAGARRIEPSWESAVLNSANPTLLIPRSGAGTASRLGATSAAQPERGEP